MKCRYCKDTGKYRQPKDVERFERLVDIEMEKAYHVKPLKMFLYNNAIQGLDL